MTSDHAQSRRQNSPFVLRPTIDDGSAPGTRHLLLLSYPQASNKRRTSHQYVTHTRSHRFRVHSTAPFPPSSSTRSRIVARQDAARHNLRLIPAATPAATGGAVPRERQRRLRSVYRRLLVKPIMTGSLFARLGCHHPRVTCNDSSPFHDDSFA